MAVPVPQCDNFVTEATPKNTDSEVDFRCQQKNPGYSRGNRIRKTKKNAGEARFAGIWY
jgi:hypothetical protein